MYRSVHAGAKKIKCMHYRLARARVRSGPFCTSMQVSCCCPRTNDTILNTLINGISVKSLRQGDTKLGAEIALGGFGQLQ
mmetsp:Transcript_110698/g.196094  ORF Transcript_110698/g.196094 Transcript_110698/m.196094 type:complete len:80 (+) Transcript_110698:151-390(+)